MEKEMMERLIMASKIVLSPQELILFQEKLAHVRLWVKKALHNTAVKEDVCFAKDLQSFQRYNINVVKTNTADDIAKMHNTRDDILSNCDNNEGMIAVVNFLDN